MCNDGPQEKLQQTKYCQPALLVTSLASLHLLKAYRPDAIEACIGTAGFSLGEITALVFAGAISFEQGILIWWDLDDILFLLRSHVVPIQYYVDFSIV